MEILEIGLLLVKAESAYNTDPTPTNASNAIPVEGKAATFEAESDDVERMILDGTADKLRGYNVLPRATLRFRYALRGNLRNGGTQLDISNGTSTQAIEIHPLLAAANMFATYTAAGTPGSEGSSAGSRDGYVTYTPISFATEGPSVTCYFQTQVKRHKMTGCKVDASLVFEAGRMAYIDFTLRGNYVAIADNAISLTSLAWSNTMPPLWIDNTGQTVTTSPLTVTGSIGAVNPVASSFNFAMGNQLIMRPSAVNTEGVKGFIIAGYNATGSFNPESVTEATNALWADWRSALVVPVVAHIGNAKGNYCTLTVNAEYKSVNYADADRRRIHQVTFKAVKSTIGAAEGNPFSLKFG